MLSACGSSGDSEDGSNVVLADFCTGMEDSSQPDFDADGLSDNCDDDGDGFNDVSDIAPLDPTQPGDFSTPEAILMQPVITQVLDELANQNILLNLELGTNPPDISGLYRIEDLSGMVVGSSNGQLIGDNGVGASVTTDSIQFMCVSEAQAYAPTESWSRTDGASCECSQNYETICVR